MTPRGTTLGAEIGGVDLGDELDDAVVADIRRALLDYKVILFRDQPITCMVRPNLGYEEDPEWQITPVEKRRKIAVVGAGPAGMECAATAAERGHDVTLYERDAKDRGIGVDTYLRELSHVDRALADGEDEGFVKIHTKKGTDQIVGATIVARHAGEMISEVSVAMAAGMGLGSVDDSAVVRVYEAQTGKPVHGK